MKGIIRYIQYEGTPSEVKELLDALEVTQDEVIKKKAKDQTPSEKKYSKVKDLIGLGFNAAKAIRKVFNRKPTGYDYQRLRFI